VLLAFITVSVWVVLNRCMVSSADMVQRMRAFETARQNMEKLLGSESVKEITEYGISEKFSDIRWQTTVESFYEPITSRMWIQAVCTAEYSDSAGQVQNVELTHWLTDLTKEQLQRLLANMELMEAQLVQHILETEREAAQYSGVDIYEIQEWVANGMPLTESGEYLKPWLDLYLRWDGSPDAESKQELLERYPELPGQHMDWSPLKQPGGQQSGSSGGPIKLPENMDPETRKTIEGMLGLSSESSSDE